MLAWPTAVGSAWLGQRAAGVGDVVPEAEYEAAFATCRDAIADQGGGNIIAGSAVVSIDGRNISLEAANSFGRLTCRLSWEAGFADVEMSITPAAQQA